jgi:NADPH:quinone reductase-like Zn-dependent oxidoreductase
MNEWVGQEALVRGLWTPERVAKFVSGELQSVIHQTFDLTRVAEAHGMMEANQNAGKIMLEVDPSIE